MLAVMVDNVNNIYSENGKNGTNSAGDVNTIHNAANAIYNGSWCKQQIFQLMLQRAAVEQDRQELSMYQTQICRALLAREVLGSTCIAPSIAVVHAQLDFIEHIYMKAGILAGPVVWDEEKISSGLFLCSLCQRL